MTDTTTKHADQSRKKLAKALTEILQQCEGSCGWAHDDDPEGYRHNQRLLKRWRKILEEHGT